MTFARLLFPCSVCCLCLLLATGCRQKPAPDESDDTAARIAAMEAAFAEYDAKAAALPYEPIVKTEDGLYVLADSNFMEAVNEGGLLVVDFWMDGCIPCEDMEPIIKGMARLYEGKIRFAKLHNGNAIMTEKYRVFGFPTFLVFDGGKLVGMVQGTQSPETMRMILDKALVNHQAKQDETVSVKRIPVK